MRPNRLRKYISALLILPCVTALAAQDESAVAETAATEDSSLSAAAAELTDKLAGTMAEINAQYRVLLQRMQEIESERRELELMMHKVSDLSEERGGTDTTGATPPAPPAAVGEEQRREFEAQQEELPELPRVSSDVGGVLTPKGRLVVEPSVQFIHSDTARLALEGFGIGQAVLVGDIDVRSVERQTFIGALTARYGITNRFEAEIKGSYLTRDDKTTTRPVLSQSSADQVFTSSGNGIGDVELGLRYQFRKRPDLPFFIGNLRIKSDTGNDPYEPQLRQLRRGGDAFEAELATGSGFWSINPSLTFVIPSDPVAIFGNVGYLWTLEDDKGTFIDNDGNIAGFGKVNPGDAIRFNFGMGIGLNESSSISFSYALDLFDETEIELVPGNKIVGSDVTVGKFLLGYSFKPTPKSVPINLAIGIGTTDAAPDTDITLRVPFTVIE